MLIYNPQVHVISYCVFGSYIHISSCIFTCDKQLASYITTLPHVFYSNDGPVSMHHVIGSASELSSVVCKPATKRRLSSTKQVCELI